MFDEAIRECIGSKSKTSYSGGVGGQTINKVEEKGDKPEKTCC